MKPCLTKKVMLLVAIALIISTGFKLGVADPEGVTPSFVSNSTKNASAPGSRSDAGGYIITMNFSVTQQNSRWKAYVGNVSGRFTLDDASGNTIYDWAITDAAITGEVFATRNDSITWSNIRCANSTLINSEDVSLSMTPAQTDSITTTFGSAVHAQFLVAGQTITNSTCQSIATWVNDTAQALTETALFQQVLLDDLNHVVYASLMEQDAAGYKGGADINETLDFQMIVANDETAITPTTYYFYVELG